MNAILIGCLIVGFIGICLVVYALCRAAKNGDMVWYE